MLRIYVGNLSYDMTTDGLREYFEQFGQVNDATVVSDRMTGRSRGFGFVEMANDDEGRAAIEATNGKELDGRSLTVNEARPREDRGGGGGYGGGRGGGRGGYGGGGGGRDRDRGGRDAW